MDGEKKTTRMPRERESSHCFLIARACISIIVYDLIYGLCSPVAFEKDYIFPVSGNSDDANIRD